MLFNCYPEYLCSNCKYYSSNGKYGTCCSKGLYPEIEEERCEAHELLHNTQELIKKMEYAWTVATEGYEPFDKAVEILKR